MWKQKGPPTCKKKQMVDLLNQLKQYGMEDLGNISEKIKCSSEQP